MEQKGGDPEGTTQNSKAKKRKNKKKKKKGGEGTSNVQEGDESFIGNNTPLKNSSKQQLDSSALDAQEDEDRESKKSNLLGRVLNFQPVIANNSEIDPGFEEFAREFERDEDLQMFQVADKDNFDTLI